MLFGFWRGQRLRAPEPRLRPGGNDEMATAELREVDTLPLATVRRSTAGAAALNQRMGDPTHVATGR